MGMHPDASILFSHTTYHIQYVHTLHFTNSAATNTAEMHSRLISHCKDVTVCVSRFRTNYPMFISIKVSIKGGETKIHSMYISLF